MEAYELQGTPAILIFDRQGRLRRHYLGAVDDLRIGAEIMALVMEETDSPREFSIAVERRLAEVTVLDGISDLSVVTQVERHELGGRTIQLPL